MIISNKIHTKNYERETNDYLCYHKKQQRLKKKRKKNLVTNIVNAKIYLLSDDNQELKLKSQMGSWMGG